MVIISFRAASDSFQTLSQKLLKSSSLKTNFNSLSDDNLACNSLKLNNKLLGNTHTEKDSALIQTPENKYVLH